MSKFAISYQMDEVGYSVEVEAVDEIIAMESLLEELAKAYPMSVVSDMNSSKVKVSKKTKDEEK